MKKIIVSHKWVGWMLLGMGAGFAAVGAAVGLPVYWFGSLQPREAAIFLIAFLASFGGVALGLMIAGGIVLAVLSSRTKRAEELRQNGTMVWADVVDVSAEPLHSINTMHPWRAFVRLRCKYEHTNGKTYIFRSPALRYDPTQMLPDGRVKVYYDRNDITRYFVDIIGSLDNNVVEL